MKYIYLISCFICLSACSSNNKETQENEESPIAVEEVVEYRDTTNYAPYISPSIDEPTSKQSSEDLSPRAQAFQNAFNLGRQLGASDAQNGERNCRAYAASYSDDWIKQQFIQGYEVGYNEVMANRSYQPGYEDNDDNYYYYEEDY